MPAQTLDLNSALSLRDRGALFVDARTPAEFAEGTIPGAVNVPLLDNDERARVGTVYKQQGKTEARRMGMDIVSPKIPSLVRKVEEFRSGKNLPVMVFCWRGGMRSGSLAIFLELAGIHALQLEGGHKVFRRHVLDFYERGDWGRLIVLRGLTGVGKTKLLLQLREKGWPVLDLEGLAVHRGSAFGSVGLPSQPSQKDFEALLWDELRHVSKGGFALAEGESRHIGRVALPKQFYQALQEETSIWINASLGHRVRMILDDYPPPGECREAYVAPILALKPRLGGETIERLLGLLGEDRQEELVRELMVLYYDPLYRHTKPPRRIEIDIEPEKEGMLRLETAIHKVLEGSDSKGLAAAGMG